MADAELASTAAAPKKAEGAALAGAIFNFIKCAALPLHAAWRSSESSARVAPQRMP